jgi:hypothetical protein
MDRSTLTTRRFRRGGCVRARHSRTSSRATRCRPDSAFGRLRLAVDGAGSLDRSRVSRPLSSVGVHLRTSRRGYPGRALESALSRCGKSASRDGHVCTDRVRPFPAAPERGGRRARSHHHTARLAGPAWMMPAATGTPCGFDRGGEAAGRGCSAAPPVPCAIKPSTTTRAVSNLNPRLSALAYGWPGPSVDELTQRSRSVPPAAPRPLNIGRHEALRAVHRGSLAWFALTAGNTAAGEMAGGWWWWLLPPGWLLWPGCCAARRMPGHRPPCSVGRPDARGQESGLARRWRPALAGAAGPWPPSHSPAAPGPSGGTTNPASSRAIGRRRRCPAARGVPFPPASTAPSVHQHEWPIAAARIRPLARSMQPAAAPPSSAVARGH